LFGETTGAPEHELLFPGDDVDDAEEEEAMKEKDGYDIEDVADDTER